MIGRAALAPVLTHQQSERGARTLYAEILSSDCGLSTPLRLRSSMWIVLAADQRGNCACQLDFATMFRAAASQRAETTGEQAHAPSAR